MKMINDLDSIAGKTAYQSYTMSHGIERMNVLVPLKNAKAFENAIKTTDAKSKPVLLEILKKHDGKLRG